MQTLRLSESLKSAIGVARSFAVENHNDRIAPPHLLRALLHPQSDVSDIFDSLGKDTNYLIEWTEVRIEEEPKVARILEEPYPDDDSLKVLDEADNVRIKLALEETDSFCLLVALTMPFVGFTEEQLKSLPLRERELLSFHAESETTKHIFDRQTADDVTASRSTNSGALHKYGTDKTAAVRDGKTDPVIGRDREIRMITEILGRRSKPNVMIIGDPGVGKTALIDGFAQSIISGDVPSNLKNAIIIELNPGALAAGASYKGEVEDRLRNIIKEIKQFEKGILFIDEIHLLLDSKGPLGNGAGNLLKPELARGELTVIGASTIDEYRKIIEPEQAFNRRFELITVTEPEVATCIKIAEAVLPGYEKHHQIKVEKEALPECVRLAKRYMKDMRLPDSALDLLDRTMSSVRMTGETSQNETESFRNSFELLKNDSKQTESDKLKEYKWLYDTLQNKLSPVLLGLLDDETDTSTFETLSEWESYLEKIITFFEKAAKEERKTVTKQEVAAVVAYKTGIPIGKVQAQERERLMNMEEYLKRRVIGQDHALKTLSDAIIENRSGLNKQGQPIGSFFFLGPTGTGKTELAKTLAEFLFNDEKAMIRFDMSEFKEEHSAALLYGAPPGYVGYEEGGMLVNKIRQQPYSVLLFDEIEKAHPSVFDTFLQVMDEGVIHDRLGKEGDFSNALIIFTSNIGSEWIAEKFQKNEMPKNTELIDLMRRHFRPEFLARLTEIVPFASITEEMAIRIFEIQMRNLEQPLHKQGITISIADEAKRTLALNGFSPQYGARQISGVIRNQLRRPISKMIIGGKLKKGDKLTLTLDASGEPEWKHSKN